MLTAWADLTIVYASPDAHRRQHDVSQLRPVHRPDRHVEGDPVRSVEGIWQKADIGGIGFADAALVPSSGRFDKRKSVKIRADGDGNRAQIPGER